MSISKEVIGSSSRSISYTDDDDGHAMTEHYKLTISNLFAWFGMKQALKNINLNIKSHVVTAIIGPSGCGKTTLIRCINRMHENDTRC